MLDPSIAEHYQSGYERSRLFPGGHPKLEFVRSLELLGRLLSSPDYRARAAATRVLCASACNRSTASSGALSASHG